MADSIGVQVRELAYLARGLRAFGRRRTPDARKRVAWLLRMGQYQRYATRRDLVSRLPLNPAVRIPEDAGYAKLDALDRGAVNDAVVAAKAHWSRFDMVGALARRGDRPFVSQGLGPILEPDDPVLRLALHPDVVAAVAHYIGMVPVIENAVMLYSPNDRRLDNSSQYFHLDGQDVRTVQMFVFLERVTAENGPLVVMRADASEALARRVGYRKTPATKRLEDETVLAAGDVVRLTGEPGDAYIIDTDRCFHLGSREGRAPRHVLVIQYYSPFAFVLPRRWDGALPFTRLVSRPGFDEIQRLVLGAR
jgi:hypothetical protein